MVNRKGFTLMEVLIAMALVAIALTSAVAVIAETTRNSSYLTHKIAADIVAKNLMDELRFQYNYNPEPVTNKTGMESMGGMNFSTAQTIVNAQMDGLKRVDITISTPDGKETLRTLSMFTFAE